MKFTASLEMWVSAVLHLLDLHHGNTFCRASGSDWPIDHNFLAYGQEFHSGSKAISMVITRSPELFLKSFDLCWKLSQLPVSWVTNILLQGASFIRFNISFSSLSELSPCAIYSGMFPKDSHITSHSFSSTVNSLSRGGSREFFRSFLLLPKIFQQIP